MHNTLLDQGPSDEESADVLAPGSAGVSPACGRLGRQTIDLVREIVAEIHGVPESDAVPLEMDSLTVVMLVEALEDRLELRVAAREVVPENLGTVAAIAAYVARKQE